MKDSKLLISIKVKSYEVVIQAVASIRRGIIVSVDWAHDHVDYLVGIAIGLIAIGYLFVLLYNKPVMSLDKKPTGLQGKELQDYLAK